MKVQIELTFSRVLRFLLNLLKYLSWVSSRLNKFQCATPELVQRSAPDTVRLHWITIRHCSKMHLIDLYG